MHWVTQYLGKPWAASPHPPLSFHCWEINRWVQVNHFNRECPDYNVLNPNDIGMVASAIHRAQDSGKWIRLVKPINGCIVAMSQSGKTDESHHVGMYLEEDGGMILHCTPRAGVTCVKKNQLIRYGLVIVGYYIHRTWLT